MVDPTFSCGVTTPIRVAVGVTTHQPGTAVACPWGHDPALSNGWVTTPMAIQNGDREPQGSRPSDFKQVGHDPERIGKRCSYVVGQRRMGTGRGPGGRGGGADDRPVAERGAPLDGEDGRAVGRRRRRRRRRRAESGIEFADAGRHLADVLAADALHRRPARQRQPQVLLQLSLEHLEHATTR